MNAKVESGTGVEISGGNSDMNKRYESARTVAQGLLNERIVKNATVFPNWIIDSDCFWYRRSTKDGREFRLVDVNTATNALAFDHEALASSLAEAVGCDVDPKNLPITDVEFNVALMEVAFSGFGKQWVFEEKTKSCRLMETDISKDWLVSPDGSYAAFSRDNNLWLRDLNNGEERALTQDGEEEFVYGAVSIAWGIEMESGLQARWSPNSKRLFSVQRDTRQVKGFPVLHHIPSDGSIRPTVNTVKLAHPGDSHVEEYRLVAIDVETTDLREANYRRVPAVRNAWGFFNAGIGWWGKDNRRAYFVDQERGDQTFRVVEFDTDTGNTRILFEESTDTHLRISPNLEDHPVFKPIVETNELIWWSERSGWSHLYLYDLDTGALKQTITQGDWLVRNVLHVDAKRRELFIQTAGRVAGRDPYYRDIARVNIDTGEIVTLSNTDHEYIVMQSKSYNSLGAAAVGYDVSEGVSPNGEFLVMTKTRADMAPASYLLDRNGLEILELEVADVSRLPDGWHWPEPVKLLAADGETDIYGLMFRPSNFSPDKSYPVISHVMNSGEWTWVSKGSFNTGNCNGVPYCDGAALAQLGFIVVQIEGRGTTLRSKAFRDESYGWAESINCLEDHITGLKQLADRYPFMDLTRVGITDHMGGSSSVMPAMLEHSDFYKVGVSGMIVDPRLMAATLNGDIYEGVSGPSSNHKYPEDRVESFSGKLLLISCLLDTCCPPAGTFRIVDALQKANKDVDLLIMPTLGHYLATGYVIRRAWDYLVRNLLNEEPPADFKLTTTIDTLLTGNSAFEIWSEDLVRWTSTD